jgi:predicted phosphohydrolase
MSVWAIADLHLALALPDKAMDFFGEPWVNYVSKIENNWLKAIAKEDLVLIAGDISWALHLPDAKRDLDWIHALPGTKMVLRGNHDYWWTSLKKLEPILPPSIQLIQNNALTWKDYAIGGARLWDSSEYQFGSYIEYAENRRARKIEPEEPQPDSEKIFERELGRLELSLKAMEKLPGKRIAMTHYPPISAQLEPSRASALLEKYGVETCVFGHLHNVRKEAQLFGKSRGVNYILTAADYLNFMPVKLYD